MDAPKELLATISGTLAFDLNLYMGIDAAPLPEIEEEEVVFVERVTELVEESRDDYYEAQAPEFEEQEELAEEPAWTPQVERVVSTGVPTPSGKGLDAAYLKALFATETYKGMKGILGELAESLALNQRFMFTKELFDGNADLLRHALKSVDELNTFEEAVELINARFVVELGWDIESEEVREFMQQVYRKFVR